MKKKVVNTIVTVVFLIVCFVVILIFAPDLFYSLSNTSKRAAIEKDKAMTSYSVADTSVSYEEIYNEFKDNKLRAEEKYKNNRYRVTAKINGMETGGLLNLTGGATLTMEIKVEETTIFFLAEFEKDQEEALKAVNVGDIIIFDGECVSAGAWTNCSIVE